MRWLALVVVGWAADAYAVPCHATTPAPLILTPATATVDDTGGIVAANPARDWELAQASVAQPFENRVIAPGLVVIPLPTNGAFDVRDAKRTVLATVTRGPTSVKPLPAPKPSAVQLKPRRSRGDDVTLTATFAAKPPDGAVALIVFAKGKPRSWGRVTGGKSVVVYRGTCQTTPPAGTLASRVGEIVTLAWLDETGHVSAPSTPVKIR